MNVAANDVKVQVEFNPARVTAYRQVGYAQHQLKKEEFRDNTVAAAQIGAAEAGNAVYVLQVNAAGQGPLATVRCRYRVPGTQDYREQEWSVPFTGEAISLEQSSPAMRLAARTTARHAFSEWLATKGPYAAEVTPDQLLHYLTGVPAIYGADTRPQKLSNGCFTRPKASRKNKGEVMRAIMNRRDAEKQRYGEMGTWNYFFAVLCASAPLRFNWLVA